MQRILDEALAYWDAKRGGRRMPARRDFDPVLEVPGLLPWMMLVDVFADPLDFRYRVIGTEIVERCARDYTWKRLTEIPGCGPDSHLWKSRVRAIETRAPVRGHPPYVGASPDVQGVEDIHLPLSDDDVTVNMILSVAAFRFR